MILRTLAPAKINLGLFVGPSMPDGRHRLASVMQSISLADELTLEHLQGDPPARSVVQNDPPTRGDVHRAPLAQSVVQSDPPARGDVHRAPPARSVVQSDPSDRSKGQSGDLIVCPGAPDLAGPENLAARALEAFRVRTGWDPGPLRLTVVKRVPVAAGLGGGSGDAAAALRLAARASGHEDEALLLELAGELGSDVPAQVAPGRWLACGAGELLQPLPDPRKPFAVLVLAHEGGLSTAEVYAELDRLGLGRDAEQLSLLAERLRVASQTGSALPARELLINDLQPAAVSLRAEIEGTLEQAREVGADVAVLSGSGPTVLGLFEGPDAEERARAAANALGGRLPTPLVAGPAVAASADVAVVRNNGPTMRATGATDAEMSA